MTRTEISNFYNRYKTHLYNASIRIVGNSMDAEEIVQDTFIKYLKFEGQMVVQQEEAWLVKTCVRASIDAVRKNKTTKSFIEDYKENSSIEQMEQQSENIWQSLKVSSGNDCLVGKIKSAMNLLSDGYRAVLSLILFEGYDYEEVAEILNIRESSVRSQYMRGKIKLLEIIQKSL